MPRRKKAYIGSSKTLVNGGRFRETKGRRPSTIVLPMDLDIENVCKQVAAHIQKFDELAQLPDRDRFITDLAHEVAWARTVRLDLLTKGARTKPDEWTTQILASGLASVMQHHGLRAAISEYEDSKHQEVQQSLYLRLIPGLIKIGGFIVPKDVKGLALRARRITREGGATT